MNEKTCCVTGHREISADRITYVEKELRCEILSAIEAKKQKSIAVFDDRIAKVQARIEGLNKQKADILSPKPPRKPRKTKKQKIQDLMKQAQKAGLKPEEIAERLGLKIQEE